MTNEMMDLAEALLNVEFRNLTAERYSGLQKIAEVVMNQVSEAENEIIGGVD